ncbi:MAG: hypothetical protein IJ190_10180 [Prevotella sp.]|nr:hypothetical protein [Prevotella sp.]
MKKIRQSINLVLSAIIVALGFGSCVSQKTYKAAQEEIGVLKAENGALKAENANLQQEISKIRDYQKRTEERRVVYGPRPTNYNENINK